MTRDELDAIRARAQAATPGPWVIGVSYSRHFGETWPVFRLLDMVDGSNDEASRDADFIQHARTDIPALLDALDAATRQNAIQSSLLALWQALVAANERVKAANPDSDPIISVTLCSDESGSVERAGWVIHFEGLDAAVGILERAPAFAGDWMRISSKAP